MAKNKGSIRGLDAIFLDNSFPENEEVTTERRTVQISDIDTKPDQPRKNFDNEAFSQLAVVPGSFRGIGYGSICSGKYAASSPAAGRFYHLGSGDSAGAADHYAGSGCFEVCDRCFADYCQSPHWISLYLLLCKHRGQNAGPGNADHIANCRVGGRSQLHRYIGDCPRLCRFDCLHSHPAFAACSLVYRGQAALKEKANAPNR